MLWVGGELNKVAGEMKKVTTFEKPTMTRLDEGEGVKESPSFTVREVLSGLADRMRQKNYSMGSGRWR